LKFETDIITGVGVSPRPLKVTLLFTGIKYHNATLR